MSARAGEVFVDAVLPEWEAAACKRMPVDDFFQAEGESIAAWRWRARRAKRVCAGCVIRWECLEWALEHREQGIWGGTTDVQREKLLRGGN